MEHIIIDITKPIEYRANNTVFTIGRFQALHKGHRHLINEAKRRFPGRRQGILTFSPDPRDFFLKQVQPKLLTKQERFTMFEALGIDIVIEFVFHESFAKLSQRAFIELMDQLHIDAIVHGQDFRFGAMESADCLKRTMMIAVEDVLLNESEKVSSSVLASYLENGNIEELNKALDYQYAISGSVVQGKQLARKLGFPTANLLIDKEKMLPGNGVYATQTMIDGKYYHSMTHVGPSPTFERQAKIVETHILDENLELYDQVITVFFYKQIRGVQTFDGIEAVQKQLCIDKSVVKQFFSE